LKVCQYSSGGSSSFYDTKVNLIKV